LGEIPEVVGVYGNETKETVATRENFKRVGEKKKHWMPPNRLGRLDKAEKKELGGQFRSKQILSRALEKKEKKA